MPADDERYDAMCKAFGTRTCHGWPMIPREKPRWWQRRMRRVERSINETIASVGHDPITEEDRAAYWKQVRMGQGIYEDAGGYIWRCWCAALSLPYEEPELTYKGLGVL